MDHKGFSLDAVSSRKLSGIAKLKTARLRIPHRTLKAMGDGGGGQTGKQKERTMGDTDVGVREVFQKQSPSEAKASTLSCR